MTNSDPLPDAAEGTGETDSQIVAWTDAFKQTVEGAVRDFAAPSNGPSGSRPSPGADPRIEAMRRARIDRFHSDPDVPLTDAELLAIADAADKAADPPWIRIRCDEAAVLVIAGELRPVLPGDAKQHRDIIRAVLAALRGEQP